MKRLVLLAALLTVPAAASAQWQVGGNFGLRTRPDGGDGKIVYGTQFEGMIVKPAGKTTHILQGAIVQMRNHDADGYNVRENSLEASYLYRRAIRGALGVAAGPAVGYSTGCASGGTRSTTYGATTCVAYYTDKGTVRPGYIVQLDVAKTNARGVTWRAGLRATGRTVASGSKTPKPVIWAGFTAPLSQR